MQHHAGAALAATRHDERRLRCGLQAEVRESALALCEWQGLLDLDDINASVDQVLIPARKPNSTSINLAAHQDAFHAEQIWGDGCAGLKYCSYDCGDDWRQCKSATDAGRVL